MIMTYGDNKEMKGGHTMMCFLISKRQKIFMAMEMKSFMDMKVLFMSKNLIEMMIYYWKNS